MYMKWALIGLLVSQAAASAFDPSNDELVADVEDSSNLKPTPTIQSYDPGADHSLFPRREGGGGGGHHNANKAAGGQGGQGGHRNANKAGGSQGESGGGEGQGGHHNTNKAKSGEGQQGQQAGHGHGSNQNKLAVQDNDKMAPETSGGRYPKGRWSQTKACIKRTGSLGNVYATLCAKPGESPTNIHSKVKASPKTTSKPTSKPKANSGSKDCKKPAMANGIKYCSTD